jgi:glycosyltransferase involved in cell wall biosynthesis
LKPECTLVIPTYNAGAFIAKSVERLAKFLKAQPEFCVLFVCDGCSDDTAEQLESLTKGQERMTVLSYAKNRGKGYAVKYGMWRCATPYRIFTDADLAYAPEEAVKVLALLKNGADMVVVNRAHPDSRFLISPMDFPNIYKRHRMSRAFNAFLRWMLPIKVLDTQAGLKGFTAEAWHQIGPNVKTDGFFIDVELLAYAGAARLRIRETPIYFEYCDPTTVKMVKHGWSMIIDTIKLRLRLQFGTLQVRRPQLDAIPTGEAQM